MLFCQANIKIMDMMDYLISMNKVCPKGTFNFETTIDSMANKGFIYQETIEDKYSVQQIIEHLQGLGADHLIQSGTDSFAMFLQERVGALTGFVNGCGKFWVQLDFENTLKILNILGLPI